MSDSQRTFKPVWQTDIKLETHVREMHIPVQLYYKMFVALPHFTPWEKSSTRTWSTLRDVTEAVSGREKEFLRFAKLGALSATSADDTAVCRHMAEI
jgi:hypothetical protein